MNALRDVWKYSPILDEEGIESTYRNPVRFSNEADLCEADGRLEDTRKKEIVVWILVAVLGVLALIALYILWLKTGVY